MLETLVIQASDSLSPADFAALLALVDPGKRHRIERFRLYRDACNCLVGDVVARSEISRITGLDPAGLSFSSNDYGKPSLVDVPGVCFNISHSGSYVACAIDEQTVGIDIELVRPIDLKIAQRFFAADETAYIMAERSEARFFEIWTKKESRIKWEGKGLSMPLTSFSVLIPEAGLRYQRVYADSAAICHVCTRRADLSVRTLSVAALLADLRSRRVL